MKKLTILTLCFACFLLPIFGEMQYIEIGSIQNATIIEVKNLSDFESLIVKNNVSVAYLQSSSKDMLINIGGTFFSFSLNGYDTLSDYKTGSVAGYKNGTEYKEANSLGLQNSTIYYFYKNNKFYSTEDCLDAYNNGFVTEKQNSASEAYYKAKSLGYTKYSDYKDYLEFTRLEYKTKEDWLNAKQKGFQYGSDYYDAISKGFANNSDYQKASNLRLENNEQFQKYNGIINPVETLVKEKSLDKKNALIYFFIQKLPKGEMSLSVLAKTLTENYNASEPPIKEALEKWLNETNGNSGYNTNNRNSRNYNTIKLNSFFNQSNLTEFFDKTDIKQLGSYNKQSEIFKKS